MKSSSFKTHYQMIQEFVRNNKIIFALWSVVLIALFGVMDFNISQKIEGYASIESVDINFNQNVTVKNIYKTVGETVQAGSLLLTLENKELSIEIARKKTEIESLEQKINQALSINAKEIINVLKADLKILRDEMIILKNKENELSVYADYDCIISNIHFSKGEYIPAFTDILSVQKKETTLVNAFINEYEQTNFKVGQSVMVENLDRSRIVEGEIILASSDISMAPERLNDLQLTNNWGQKLVIKLRKPVFKRGEKLMIQVLKDGDKKSIFSTAKAGDDEEPTMVTILDSKKELSAIKKLSERLFLISDDEGKKLESSVGLYDLEHNKITKIQIDENEKIEDVESIIVDGNRVLVVASMSETRKGQNKKSRNKIIVLEKNSDNSFKYVTSIEIAKELKKTLKDSFGNELNLEIEAADASANHYILALKETVNSKHIFIKIKKSDLLAGNLDNITINTLQTPLRGHGLTSMKVEGNKVLLVLNQNENSHIFKSTLDLNDTELVASVEEKIEGIEVYENYFLLCVDQNRKSGKILRHKYVR